ncbi:MAG: gliding motility-associated C-terminal domain-containing protein [Chitinophagales bacterium]
MKKLYAFAFLTGTALSAFSQALFNNNGADIYVKDGGFMIVKTNSLYNTQVAGSGIIDNQGTIVVEGNVTNDGNINAAGDTIRLSGDWINNSAYAGANSWVDMYGGNQQITGTAVTTFNNLNLGGGSVVKRQTIDAVTSGTLALNSAELATDVNEMLVSNSSTGAITWSSGFVSSLGAGKLSRATNLAGSYTYPTGSPSYNNPPSIYRPLQMQPSSASANVYGAMVVKGDATTDGYDVTVVDDLLCKVNPNFYHRLYHSNGNDAMALTMFYDASSDGDWTDQGHWDAPNRWNYLGNATAGSGLGFSSVSVGGVSDFQPEPFALARKKFTVNAGPDVDLVLGQSTTFNPTNTAVNVQSYLWTPDATLSCGTCEKPDATPITTTQYLLTVEDDAGCKASDSLIVKVSSPELLIPTAFSPNGDGFNDKFRVLNKDVIKLDLQIFNRWGELVFETSDPLEGWDGVYKGMEQELGVYVWKCDYILNGQTKTKSAKGNLTLMR